MEGLHREDWRCYFLEDSFRGVTQDHARESGAGDRAHDDEIDGVLGAELRHHILGGSLAEVDVVVIKRRVVLLEEAIEEMRAVVAGLLQEALHRRRTKARAKHEFILAEPFPDEAQQVAPRRLGRE